MQLIISCLLFTTMLMKNVSAGPAYVGTAVCQYHENDNYHWVHPYSMYGAVGWADAAHLCNKSCEKKNTSHFVIGDVKKGEDYDFFSYDVKCWCEGTKTYPCGTKKFDANKWLYKVD